MSLLTWLLFLNKVIESTFLVGFLVCTSSMLCKRETTYLSGLLPAFLILLMVQTLYSFFMKLYKKKIKISMTNFSDLSHQLFLPKNWDVWKNIFSLFLCFWPDAGPIYINIYKYILCFNELTFCPKGCAYIKRLWIFLDENCVL